MHPLALLPFPVLALIMGLAYVCGDPARTSSRSFEVARRLAPISEWGWLFIVGAVILFAALALSNLPLLTCALVVGGGIYTFWAVLFARSAAEDPRASLTAWAIHGTIALFHFVAAYWIRSNHA